MGRKCGKNWRLFSQIFELCVSPPLQLHIGYSKKIVKTKLQKSIIFNIDFDYGVLNLQKKYWNIQLVFINQALILQWIWMASNKHSTKLPWFNFHWYTFQFNFAIELVFLKVKKQALFLGSVPLTIVWVWVELKLNIFSWLLAEMKVSSTQRDHVFANLRW